MSEYDDIKIAARLREPFTFADFAAAAGTDEADAETRVRFLRGASWLTSEYDSIKGEVYSLSAESRRQAELGNY